MSFLKFFYPNRPGFLLIVVGGIMFVAYVIHQGQEKSQQGQNSNQPKRDLGSINPKTVVDTAVASKESVLSNRQLSLIRVETDPVKTTQTPEVTQQRTALPTLVSFYSQVAATPTPTPKPRQEPEQLWLPPSIFIPCALVNTVNSSHIDTPVVGEVLRDVYQNKKLVIAAGTIVSSFAGKAVRDRIAVAGNWLLVFHDGRQLKISGIACVRQADAENQQFGPEDASAGLMGELKESDHWANAKAFLALLMTSVNQVVTAGANSAVSGVHGGYGGGVALPDTSQIQAKYLDQLLNGENGDGRYVHVPASTEFYIFPTETVLPLRRSIENSASTKEDASPPSTDPILQQATQTAREIMRASQQPTPDENQTPKFRY